MMLNHAKDYSSTRLCERIYLLHNSTPKMVEEHLVMTVRRELGCCTSNETDEQEIVLEPRKLEIVSEEEYKQRLDAQFTAAELKVLHLQASYLFACAILKELDKKQLKKVER